MAPELAEVLATAKSLERDQIADLTYQLLRVLDGEPEADQKHVDAAWRVELHHRVDDMETGRVQPVSHKETVAQARALLAARRK